jgi:hypothetical protein
MPAFYFIIKKFLERYQPIQKKLEEVEFSLEVERLMQTLASIPADELKAKLASSGVTFQKLNLSPEEFLKNFKVLLEAEKARHELQKVTLQEIRNMNEALIAAQNKVADMHQSVYDAVNQNKK